MTTKETGRAFVTHLRDAYLGRWTDQLLIYFTVLALSTGAALVANFRFRLAESTVLVLAIVLTIILLVAIPTVYMDITNETGFGAKRILTLKNYLRRFIETKRSKDREAERLQILYVLKRLMAIRRQIQFDEETKVRNTYITFLEQEVSEGGMSVGARDAVQSVLRGVRKADERLREFNERVTKTNMDLDEYQLADMFLQAFASGVSDASLILIKQLVAMFDQDYVKWRCPDIADQLDHEQELHIPRS